MSAEDVGKGIRAALERRRAQDPRVVALRALIAEELLARGLVAESVPAGDPLAPIRWRVLVGQDPKLPEGVTIEHWGALNVDGAKASSRPEGWRVAMVYPSLAAAQQGLELRAERGRAEAVAHMHRAQAAQSLAEHVALMGAEQVSEHQALPSVPPLL